MQFEGEHRQIVLRGIERAGQDTMIQDGAMNEVIGMDMRDGSYVPYAPTSEDVSLPKDTIVVRWHHTSTGNNLIAVDNKLSLFFKKEHNDAWQYVCQLPSSEIAFLGNAICTTESGFYLLWKDSGYNVIKNHTYPRVLLRTHDNTNKDKAFFVTGDGWNDETRYAATCRKCEEAGYLYQMHLCRYAIELTNGSYCFVSAPFLIQHPHAKANYMIVRNGAHKEYYNINAPYYEEGRLWWSELQYRLDEDFNAEEVLRVSIFLTKGFDMFNAAKMTDNYPTWDMEYYESLQNSLQGEDLYYKVYDIYPNDLKASNEWKSINLAGKIGTDHIVNQTVLPIMVSETYIAEQLFVYNRRLHMMNIKRRIENDIRLDEYMYRSSGPSDFNSEFAVSPNPGSGTIMNSLTSIFLDGSYGFTDGYWYKVNRYYSSADITNGKLDLRCSFIGNATFYFEDGTSYSYDGTGDKTFAQVLSQSGHNLIMSPYRITIWYKSDSGEELVSVHDGFYYDSVLYNINPYLSVSNKKATRILLEVMFDGNHYLIDKPLKASSTQNVAYYLDEDCRPITWEQGNGSFDITDKRDSEEITHMVVSETNMPNVFDLEAYRIGTSRRVVGVSFYSFDVTSDNFGNYPLVVFCEDGVYLLRIEDSGEYAYRRTDKISEDVCTNRRSICRTNAGIVFATERGLMSLTNKGVQEAFRHLIGEPKHVAKNNDALGHGLKIFYCAVNGEENGYKLSDMYGQLSHDDVRTQIQNNCEIEYDTHIGKLILWSSDAQYVYMIDVASGMTTKVHADIMLSDKEGGYYESGD